MKAKTVWLYGLPSCGKTTLASELSAWDNFLLLDGDDVREVLDTGLGYSEQERNELAIRYAKLCELVNKQNIDCILC